MQTLDEMPEGKEPGRPKKEGLRIHQIRVLRAIGTSRGPISRARIADKADISPTVVSRALGYEDPELRAKFEAESKEGGYPSLLTLGMVQEHRLDIDGKEEVAYSLNANGRKEYERLRSVHIPPPKQ